MFNVSNGCIMSACIIYLSGHKMRDLHVRVKYYSTGVSFVGSTFSCVCFIYLEFGHSSFFDVISIPHMHKKSIVQNKIR